MRPARSSVGTMIDSSDPSTSASGVPTSGSPVVEYSDIRLRTRSGCSIAIVWAIMPPIDEPHTCAVSMPSWSSRPMPSAAMSDSV